MEARTIRILQLLATSSFITINKEIAKKFGLDSAVLLGELASELDYWTKKNGLVDGYFFSTVENIEENTTLKEHRQRKAINNLKSLGILDVTVKGLPAKRYIKIDENKLLEYLGTSYADFKELDTENSSRNNNIYNNNINNNNPPIIPQGDEGVFIRSSNSKVKDFEQRDSELKKKFLELCEMYPKEKLWNNSRDEELAFKSFLNSINKDKEDMKRGIKDDVNILERMRIGLELYIKNGQHSTIEHYKSIKTIFWEETWKSYYEEEKRKNSAKKKKEDKQRAYLKEQERLAEERRKKLENFTEEDALREMQEFLEESKEKGDTKEFVLSVVGEDYKDIVDKVYGKE